MGIRACEGCKITPIFKNLIFDFETAQFLCASCFKKRKKEREELLLEKRRRNERMPNDVRWSL